MSSCGAPAGAVTTEGNVTVITAPSTDSCKVAMTVASPICETGVASSTRYHTDIQSDVRHKERGTSVLRDTVATIVVG